ncbi:hypothetical protein EB077_13640, partial [bacterium]|nr:hypothetical protein [bacterium]
MSGEATAAQAPTVAVSFDRCLADVVAEGPEDVDNVGDRVARLVGEYPSDLRLPVGGHCRDRCACVALGAG